MPQKYDFYDFGCGAGGNISFLKSILPDVRGLGIDIDEKKISLARANGHDVLQCNTLDIPDHKVVSFVAMAHVLEHLPDLATASAVIEKGINLSRDFVHIRQPFVDCDGYLLRQGLKLYWSDWRGHRNSITSLDFYKILRTLEKRRSINSFAIYARGLIENSQHSSVVPLNSPIDSLAYIADYGPKPEIEFDFPVFSEIVVDILIDRDAQEEGRRTILSKLGQKMPLSPLYQSESYSLVIQ